MRALIVADVHANLAAFQAVLSDAVAASGFDAIWSLGDLVGYGAEPEECVQLLRGHPNVAIAGNHDLAALDVRLTADFNPYAAAAARWTGERLSADSADWIRGLPQVTVTEAEFTLTHGSLVDPIWEYLVSVEVAAAHLALQQTTYGFVGHSHLPLLFVDGDATEASFEDGTVTLGGTRFVANPGSVGQPRDGDPRAAYAIVDTRARTLTLRRVEYDIATTQRKIRDAGLPEFLAARLAMGR
jgi:diadenosine tetraphosphatase ApaH/serine/threonine PP2A family protein phosphatase